MDHLLSVLRDMKLARYDPGADEPKRGVEGGLDIKIFGSKLMIGGAILRIGDSG